MTIWSGLSPTKFHHFNLCFYEQCCHSIAQLKLLGFTKRTLIRLYQLSMAVEPNTSNLGLK